MGCGGSKLDYDPDRQGSKGIDPACKTDGITGDEADRRLAALSGSAEAQALQQQQSAPACAPVAAPEDVVPEVPPSMQVQCQKTAPKLQRVKSAQRFRDHFVELTPMMVMTFEDFRRTARARARMSPRPRAC